MRRFAEIAFVVWALLFLGEGMVAQSRAEELARQRKELYTKAKVVDGDTIPHVLLGEVVVMKPWEFKNRREYNQYHRLVRNIKVTLPYARLAAERLEVYNYEMSLLKTEKQRKAYLKEAEQELFAEFEAPLRKLSFSQGRLLIKLIDRETGASSYNLIRDYKGGVPAFFWQGIARIFGANLKSEYDAEEEDRMVEHIITMIDNGAL